MKRYQQHHQQIQNMEEFDRYLSTASALATSPCSIVSEIVVPALPPKIAVFSSALNFHDPNSSLELNRAILGCDFALTLPYFPIRNLCPVVRRSLQYLTWVRRLFLARVYM